MGQEKQNYDDINQIEQKIKELFCYDDTSLLAEMEEVELEWEAHKEAAPELTARLQAYAANQFKKLMERVEKDGLGCVTEDDYEQRQALEQEENREIELFNDLAAEMTEKKRGKMSERRSRKAPSQNTKKSAAFKILRKREILLVAVVYMLAVGTTIVATANRDYKYELYPVQSRQIRLFKGGEKFTNKEDKLEKAYNEIEEVTGIQPLALGHIPEEMIFRHAKIDKNRAILELEFKGKSVYLKEERYEEEMEGAHMKMSDRTVYRQVKNPWLDETISIERNILDSDTTEYSAGIRLNGASYYLSGIMDEKEFIDMVKGLCYP